MTNLKNVFTESAPTLLLDALGGAALFVILMGGLTLPSLF